MSHGLGKHFQLNAGWNFRRINIFDCWEEEELIFLTVGRKPLGGLPPNPLSAVLTEGVRGSHRVVPMMPKDRTSFSSRSVARLHVIVEFKNNRYF